jgi:putative membrane protein insertion efficiency factor
VKARHGSAGQSEEVERVPQGRHAFSPPVIVVVSNMRNFAKLVTLQLLRAYKWAISPMFPPACRYVPTCSEYAMEAVERYGALRGGWMAFTRILRCHPFARSGYDPVVKQRGT